MARHHQKDEKLWGCQDGMSRILTLGGQKNGKASISHQYRKA
jgi:hypothetical protein